MTPCRRSELPARDSWRSIEGLAMNYVGYAFWAAAAGALIPVMGPRYRHLLLCVLGPARLIGPFLLREQAA